MSTGDTWSDIVATSPSEALVSRNDSCRSRNCRKSHWQLKLSQKITRLFAPKAEIDKTVKTSAKL